MGAEDKIDRRGLDTDMTACICVGAGGFVGAVFRYLLSGLHTGSSGFPVMTFIINIAGAFAIGALMGAAEKTGFPDGNLMLFLKVGVCGGFTTFSTYALELSGLFTEGKWSMGVLYGLLSVVLCLGAVYAGQAAAKALM